LKHYSGLQICRWLSPLGALGVSSARSESLPGNAFIGYPNPGSRFVGDVKSQTTYPAKVKGTRLYGNLIESPSPKPPLGDDLAVADQLTLRCRSSMLSSSDWSLRFFATCPKRTMPLTPMPTARNVTRLDQGRLMLRALNHGGDAHVGIAVLLQEDAQTPRYPL
jgi:hypothetical protein